jgi:hypothetical protein
MAVVELKINAPTNNQTFVGSVATNISFAGEPRPAGVDVSGLFFKWYSSLLGELNTALSFTRSLSIGTHVITFSVKDRAGDDRAALEQVRQAGMAGGAPSGVVPPPANEAPCVVHVFVAKLILPPPDGPSPSYSRGSAIELRALAPDQWDQPSYQALNRIRYRWIFTPGGASSGPELLPAPEMLVLKVPNEVPEPQVIYNGPLPAGLNAGAHTLTLRVEDKTNPSMGHAVSRPITII